MLSAQVKIIFIYLLTDVFLQMFDTDFSVMYFTLHNIVVGKSWPCVQLGLKIRIFFCSNILADVSGPVHKKHDL